MKTIIIDEIKYIPLKSIESLLPEKAPYDTKYYDGWNDCRQQIIQSAKEKFGIKIKKPAP